MFPLQVLSAGWRCLHSFVSKLWMCWQQENNGKLEWGTCFAIKGQDKEKTHHRFVCGQMKFYTLLFQPIFRCPCLIVRESTVRIWQPANWWCESRWEQSLHIWIQMEFFHTEHSRIVWICQLPQYQELQRQNISVWIRPIRKRQLNYNVF